MQSLIVVARQTDKTEHGSGGLWSRFEVIVYCLFAWMVSRFLFIAIGMLSQASQNMPIDFEAMWIHWDSGWYLSILNEGYHLNADPTRANPLMTNLSFFPLYPLLIHPLARLIPPTLAGIVMSNLFTLIGALYFYFYCQARFGKRMAEYAVAMLFFVTGSFAFSSLLTEPLFMMLLAMIFYYTDKGHYGAVALAAGLLSVTRANGVFIFAGLGLWLLQEKWRDARQFRFYRQAFIVLLGLSIPFLYVGYMYMRFGDAFAVIHSIRDAWGVRPDAPFEALFHFLDAAHPQPAVQSLVLLAMTLIFMLQCRRLRSYEITFMILSLWSCTANASLISSLRYLTPLLPLHMALALGAEKNKYVFIMTLGLILLNGVAMFLWVRNDTLFV